MSPEQVRGQLATPRSDVFALGCVLYEMLSGRSPFARASKADALAAILEAEAPAVERAGDEAPRSVATVLTKCLAKDPGARYADASPLLADLEAVCREIDGPPRDRGALDRRVAAPARDRDPASPRRRRRRVRDLPLERATRAGDVGASDRDPRSATTDGREPLVRGLRARGRSAIRGGCRCLLSRPCGHR